MRLCECIPCPYEVEITGITADSRNVKPGYLFVALSGKTFDGHQFISEVKEKGAAAVLVEKDVETSLPMVKVPDTKTALLSVLTKFYQDPLSKLSLIGVTGTDGKTTTASLVYQLLSFFAPVGYLGTNGCDFEDFHEKTHNTTPIPEEMYSCLSHLVERGCKYLSMEVSSEAILAGRVDPFSFAVTIFTNVTEDHLNVHKTIENYVATKARLFEKTTRDGVSILNFDDEHFSVMKEHATGQVISYGEKEGADYRILDWQATEEGSTFSLTNGHSKWTIKSPYFGRYNAFNLTAALLTVSSLGYPLGDVISKTEKLKPILGRGEYLDFGQEYTILLDYAHTAKAIEEVLTAVQQNKKGKIYTVMGSAGGREKEKRGKMGAVALALSDYVIFTMDDPREESVDAIIDDLVMDTTATHYERVLDRQEAIYRAFSLATKEDTVCILGKGRDDYMAIGKEYLPYNDYEVISSYFVH